MIFSYSKKTIDSFMHYLMKRLSRQEDRVTRLEKVNLKAMLNQKECLKVVLDSWGTMPTKAYTFDAGFDLYSPRTIRYKDVIKVWFAGGNLTVGTGVHIQIPEGYVGLIMSRSSMALHGIPCVTGVVDAGFQGELKITYENSDLFMFMSMRQSNDKHTLPFEGTLSEDDNAIVFRKGDRIAQIVIVPIPSFTLTQVDSFEEKSERGSAGFGSTGK